jgi:hypothetical protein
MIRVYDAAGNMIETHEHAGEFREPWERIPSKFASHQRHTFVKQKFLVVVPKAAERSL